MPIVASPDGLPGNAGTEVSPLSLDGGLAALITPGQDVLYLRGGTYVGQVSIQNLHGAASDPKIIRSFPGEHATIDGTIADFRDAPNDLWDKVGGHNSDEYVSVNPYPIDLVGSNHVARGSFLDRVPHTRLITHQFLEDLQADNERSGPIPDDHPLDGPEPKAGAERRPWVYMGPGLHQTPDGHIHVRLSPTHNYVAGFPDYDEMNDPCKVPLAIWTLQQGTLRIVGCEHVHLSDLTVRHGDTAVVIDGSLDVRLDHLNIFAGSDGVKLRGACRGTVLTHCLIDGGMPSWYFRSDRKGDFALVSDGDDPPQAPGQNTVKALLSGTTACTHTRISYCEFVNGHDISLFGDDLEFSRNWIRNIDDDAIIAETEGSSNLRIFGNVVEQCQTGISFGVKKAGKGAWVYRNLFDLRRQFAKSRPRSYEVLDAADPESEETRTLALGQFFKSNRPDGALHLFQNTCVVKDRTGQSSFGHFNGYAGDAVRRSFNNVFVSVNSVSRADKPIALLPDPNLPAGTDGNCFRRVGQYVGGALIAHRGYPQTTPVVPATSFASLEELRDPVASPSPIFTESQGTYAPGFERSSIEEDPLFRRFNGAQNGPSGNDDMRLSFDSPARNAGVTLPDDLRELDGAPPLQRPDIGCFRYGALPLSVGVDGRRRFPSDGPPEGVAG